jgi:hypothetical protein
MQHRLDDADRTAHYRRQASACATAALATAIAELRQAYLDLEQGWLCLAAKGDGSSAASALPKSADEVDPPPNRASESSHGATA